MSPRKAPDDPKAVQDPPVPSGGATEASDATAEKPVRDPKWDPGFPLNSFKDAATHLRRPFTPAAVKFKVQSNLGEKGAMVVAYIDVRLVTERLNLIVPHLWSDEFKPLDGNHILCRLTVDDITRHDVGQGSGKAGYTDALKRAGVKFGVGVSLYAIPRVHLWLSNDKGWLTSRKKKNGELLFEITEKGEEALRRGYEKWLIEVGEPRFGPLLDHGDTEVSVGDPDEPTDVPEDDDEPIRELLDTEEAEAKREEARGLYEQIKGVNGSVEKFPPGQFAAGLRDHGHSLEALDEYVAHLRARVEARP